LRENHSQNVKAFFTEQIDNLQQVKTLLGGIVEEVRERVQESTFERIYKQGIKNE
jgi:hypothetical protein